MRAGANDEDRAQATNGRPVRSTGHTRSLLRALMLTPLVAALIVAGCGMTTSTTGSGATTQCGQVVGLGATYHVSATPSTAETCLWQAYSQCQAATMSYTQQDVDVSTTDAISVRPVGGACSVKMAVQHMALIKTSGKGSNNTAMYTCTGIQQRTDGLLITGCGAAGNVHVPKAS